jgi:hypothetical protein
VVVVVAVVVVVVIVVAVVVVVVAAVVVVVVLVSSLFVVKSGQVPRILVHQNCCKETIRGPRKTLKNNIEITPRAKGCKNNKRNSSQRLIVIIF